MSTPNTNPITGPEAAQAIAPMPGPTPASIEGIHQRLKDLETRGFRFEQTAWDTVQSKIYDITAHVKNISFASAGLSLTALALRIFHHIA
jgi:hypothetical protein